VDAARIQEFLKINGYTVTARIADADVILFNACGGRESNERAAERIISRIKARKKNGAQLIVGGCLPKINKAFRHGTTFGVDDDLIVLDQLFNAKTSIRDIHANYTVAKTDNLDSVFRKVLRRKTLVRKLRQCDALLRPGKYEGMDLNPSRFIIKVSTGCIGACSFCAVRLSRGKLKSKPVDRVVNEFETGLRKGYRQFFLVGTDVGCYGRDQGYNLVTLLKELTSSNGDYKIKIRNCEPSMLVEMLPALEPVLQSGKISHFTTAAQSGNNRILRLMNRKYRIEDFKQAIKTLNQDFPQMEIVTQIVVGFPTETDEDFQDTLRLLDEVRFDAVGAFAFSPRAGTKAAELDGRVPRRIAVKRLRELRRRSNVPVISSSS
jgi:MiaB/RimO family radical SAM methylthiotransferase